MHLQIQPFCILYFAFCICILFLHLEKHTKQCTKEPRTLVLPYNRRYFPWPNNLSGEE